MVFLEVFLGLDICWLKDVVLKFSGFCSGVSFIPGFPGVWSIFVLVC